MSRDNRYTLYIYYLSFFSGKMQAYLRYKEVPHRIIEPKWGEVLDLIYPNTGLMKVPVIQTPEGRWLADTTPMIDWFEARFPAGAVLPDDPYQAFFSRLLEDYADEWLWRPALYYRFGVQPDADLLSRRYAATFLSDAPLPRWLIALQAVQRSRKAYVDGDGVNSETKAHVESIFLNTLDRLQEMFEARPFMLGGRPSLADFGFFASMFRHGALDPTPSLLMLERAPAVYEWVGRMWNARHSKIAGKWASAGEVPQDWNPILKDIGEAYLPYLHANAIAYREGRRRFDLLIQGVRYRAFNVSPYRVWCRERLQDHLAAVPAGARPAVKATLNSSDCLEPLQRDGRIESGLYRDVTPPVCRTRKVRMMEKLVLYFSGTTHWFQPRASQGYFPM
ncbi:MAG: glutathione S-transferase family protein [Burkholderiales bacterium]